MTLVWREMEWPPRNHLISLVKSVFSLITWCVVFIEWTQWLFREKVFGAILCLTKTGPWSFVMKPLWIPITKGWQCRKCFYVMTSSCTDFTPSWFKGGQIGLQRLNQCPWWNLFWFHHMACLLSWMVVCGGCAFGAVPYLTNIYKKFSSFFGGCT